MSDYIEFVEERLDLGYDYGAIGGMRFKTTIIKDGEKNEQRNADWWLPLGRWQLGERSLLVSEFEGINELKYLQGFHSQRKGSKQGFRFKDWSDYQAIEEYIGVGNGSETQWQLTKTYAADLHLTYRPITKPVEGTVKVYLDGLNSSTGWSVDYATGILTFDTAPSSGIMIDSTFEFDVPVWFETDEFSYTLEGYQKDSQTGEITAIYRLGNLAVQEGRIPLSLPYNYLLPVPQKLEHTLNLGIIDNTLAKDEFDTSKESVTSGYIRRDSNIQEAESYLEISKNWNQEELDNLLNFFWNCKGKASTFILALNNKKYLVRFKEDNLNIKFLVYDRATEDSIYAIANLGFYVFECIEDLPILPGFTTGLEFLDFGVGNTERSTPLTPGYGSGIASGGGGSGSGSGSGLGGAGGTGSGANGGGGAGFAVGTGLVSSTIPPTMNPTAVTEVNGLPVLLGRFEGNYFLAKPNESFDGNFNLVALDIFHSGQVFEAFKMSEGGRVHTVLRDKETDEVWLLTINLDLTHKLDLIGTSTADGVHNFFIVKTTVYWTSFTSDFYPPSSVNGLNLYVRNASTNQTAYPIAIADDERAVGILPNSVFVAPTNASAVSGLTKNKIYSYINGNWEVEFDFTPSGALSGSRIVKSNKSFLHAAYDPTGETAVLMYPFFMLYEPVNLVSLNAETDSLVQYAGVFEIIDNVLYWQGALPYIDNSTTTLSWERFTEHYFKRNLIAKRAPGIWTFINAPSGVQMDFQDIVNVNPQSVSVGLNYVAILFNNNGWKISFMNISNG